MLEELSRFPLLSSLEKENIPQLLDSLHPVKFLDGEHLYKSGAVVDSLLFLRQGYVRYRIEGGNVVPGGHRKDAEAGQGEVFGLFALMTGSPAISSVVAAETVDALELRKKDFDRLRSISPGFEAACRELAQERLEALRQEEAEQEAQIRSWFVDAMRGITAARDVSYRGATSTSRSGAR